ncbi:MAG: DUF5668 domain-containing protein [Patescibacteria group bacterium]|jgi:uncharacterized membrane protein HdeD (DUF308 family)
MSKSRIFWGVVMIALGLLLLADQFGLDINFGSFWPIFLLLPGIALWVIFFWNKNRDGGLLIPGTILIIYSLYFFYNEYTNYKFAGETSFLFTLAIGLGFFCAYYFPQKKNRGYLIPGWILTTVSAIVLLSTVTDGKWWPIIIIIAGLFLLYKRNKLENHQEEFEKNE